MKWPAYLPYPISWLRAIISANLYGFFVMAGWDRTQKLPEIAALPLAGTIELFILMLLSHHLVAVLSACIARIWPQWLPGYAQAKARFRKRNLLIPAWDSWQEGINAFIVALVMLSIVSAIFAVSLTAALEKMPPEEAFQSVIGLFIGIGKSTAIEMLNTNGIPVSEVEGVRDLAYEQFFRPAAFRLGIFWVCTSAFLYQYLLLLGLRQPSAKAIESQNAGSTGLELDPVEMELNQLKHKQGTTKITPAKRPKPKTKT